MAKSSLPVSKLHSNMLATRDRTSVAAEVEGGVERTRMDVLVPRGNNLHLLPTRGQSLSRLTGDSSGQEVREKAGRKKQMS